MSSPSKKPTILVCNDDGIRSLGIQVLVKALKRIAAVVVVAPESEQSAASHALTMHRPLRIHRYAENSYSVDGTPADCVTLAVHKILKKKPDFIVSGINQGANLGIDVHYSGTVSAAMEGSFLKIPSIAVSMVLNNPEKLYFESAGRFVTKLIRVMQSHDLPPELVLNVNVPNLPWNKMKGCEFTKLGRRDYGEVIFEKTDPRNRFYYWIGGEQHRYLDIPGSDCNAIVASKISVTPLQVDMTHYHYLETTRDWMKSLKF